MTYHKNTDFSLQHTLTYIILYHILHTACIHYDVYIPCPPLDSVLRLHQPATHEAIIRHYAVIELTVVLHTNLYSV